MECEWSMASESVDNNKEANGRDLFQNCITAMPGESEENRNTFNNSQYPDRDSN
jgi:hypothetical protein